MTARMDEAVKGPVHPDVVDEPHCTPEEGCITCGDVAVELTVVSIDRGRELALCETADGRRESVEIALVQPVGEGNTLLVHAGTAIARLG